MGLDKNSEQPETGDEVWVKQVTKT
jgi:hypothetical protein